MSELFAELQVDQQASEKGDFSLASNLVGSVVDCLAHFLLTALLLEAGNNTIDSGMTTGLELADALLSWDRGQIFGGTLGTFLVETQEVM